MHHLNHDQHYKQCDVMATYCLRNQVSDFQGTLFSSQTSSAPIKPELCHQLFIESRLPPSVKGQPRPLRMTKCCLLTLKRCLGKYPFLNTTGFPLMKYELVSLWLWTNNFDFRGNLVRALLAFNYSFNIQLPSPNPQFHC